MSQKSPVSNFTSADDEVLAFLSNLGQKWRKSDDVANFIERNFTFVGSKPLLQNLKDSLIKFVNFFLSKRETRGLKLRGRPLISLYIPQSPRTLEVHAMALKHCMRFMRENL